MKEMIKQFNLSDEFYISEGCHIIEISNTPDDQDVSIARARVKPGVTTRWHRLEGISERYVILEGQGRVEIGNHSPKNVSAGDVVLIPPMSIQRISNIGSKDLIFLAICSPRFVVDAYQDVENNISRIQIS